MSHKNHSTYSNGNCIHKYSCRYILQGLLGDLDLHELYSLTLPSNNFELETKLWNTYKYCHLQTSELNEGVYEQQLEFANKELIYPTRKVLNKRITLNYGDVLDTCSTSLLNFIWLDFCGYLTETLFNRLEEFFKSNDLRRRGVFAITLLSARENVNAQAFFRKLQKDKLGTSFIDLQNFRNVQFPKILGKLLSEVYTNYKFRLSCNYSYKPTSGGNTMTMYAFNWEREDFS